VPGQGRPASGRTSARGRTAGQLPPAWRGGWGRQELAEYREEGGKEALPSAS
jgi:hypothetical protein